MNLTSVPFGGFPMCHGADGLAALATVVEVLIEVPVMLMLVSICKRYCHLFKECHLGLPWCKNRDMLGEVEGVR
mgnify:CR=1 FL=1